jgi:hypothetical protein
MMEIKRLHETKKQRARRLSIGTWFVYPDILPRKYTYYQPRVYRALADGGVSEAVYADFGVWEQQSGPNTPQAAYERATVIAQDLNARNADEQAAIKHVAWLKRQRVAAAMGRLGNLLSGRHRG